MEKPQDDSWKSISPSASNVIVQAIEKSSDETQEEIAQNMLEIIN